MSTGLLKARPNVVSLPSQTKTEDTTVISCVRVSFIFIHPLSLSLSPRANPPSLYSQLPTPETLEILSLICNHGYLSLSLSLLLPFWINLVFVCDANHQNVWMLFLQVSHGIQCTRGVRLEARRRRGGRSESNVHLLIFY